MLKQRGLSMTKQNNKQGDLLGAAPETARQTVEDNLLGRPHVAEKAFSTEATKVLPKGEKTPEQRFAELQDMTRSYLTDAEEDKLAKAFKFAAAAHEGACRKSGEPFIAHPVEVAIILADLRMDVETLCAALLHDTVEDTDVTSQLVEQEFGPHVAQLVDGVTKITRIEVETLTDEQAATIRKMFVAMSKDIRVIVIKLADRLHNMRTLAALKEDRRIFKSRETLEIYAPIAHRLGINSIKWELEDLSFYYLEPNKFKQVSRMVTESRAEREEYLEQVISVLRGEMDKVGIQAQIMGRPKHLYSIYQKMAKKGKGFSEIYDLIAVRIIVKSVKDCYSALGAVHTLWHPMPGRFKDYIAMPKFNMYQSLHTTVIGPAGRPLEVQIRTEEMHRQSEYGVAAHWRYKEKGGRGSNDAMDKQLAWLREMVDWQDETHDSREFLKDLKVDLAPTEVFVFTPKGEAMSLRAGSTPVDFAYAIHTEVGNHCVGAKVNGAIVPLAYELQLGDRVEILTQKSASPSRDWLNIVKTPSARNKIRSYFSKVSRADDLLNGRDKLGREMRKHGLGISNARSGARCAPWPTTWATKDADDMLVNIGTSKESVQSVANRLLTELGKKNRRAARPAEPCRRGHDHGQTAANAHAGEQAEEAADEKLERRGGGRRGGRARAPVALLQPRAGRRDHRLRHARARRVGASPRLPKRQGADGAARAHHEGALGKRFAEEHVVQGGGVHRGARPPAFAVRRGGCAVRHGRERAVVEHGVASRWHGGDALFVPGQRHHAHRHHLKQAQGA